METEPEQIQPLPPHGDTDPPEEPVDELRRELTYTRKGAALVGHEVEREEDFR